MTNPVLLVARPSVARTAQRLGVSCARSLPRTLPNNALQHDGAPAPLVRPTIRVNP